MHLLGRPSGIRAFAFRLAGVAVAACLAFPGQAAAGGLVGARLAAKSYSGGPAATAATVERSPDQARIAFDLNLPVEAKAYVLADPDRVVVDLPEIGFLLDPAVGRLASLSRHAKTPPPLVSSFRFGQFAPGRSRIVIDLSGPARIVKAASEPTPSGGASRLVIQLAATDPDSFRAAARAARAVQLLAAPAPENAGEMTVPPKSSLPTVYIDPGHGGVDMGAVSPNGVYEKSIVLEFGRELAARLEKGGRVKPMMTRSDDVFIPLSQRVKIARDGGASLFISIHADTLYEGAVHGATIYTISDRASDAEAARLAAKENNADQAGGLANSEDAVDVNDILADLTRRETRAMSHVFAYDLAARWKAAGDLNKNPLRSAGFVVLKAPDVPSVLLELGYLSSAQDIAKLTAAEWRRRATERVAEAIERYFARPQGAQDHTAAVVVDGPRPSATPH
ncbi:MAG: N-acetylmuramoyl-L-alanine amidase [Hyphomicrobiales bacterium]|nr:N-acetylmuramoyl-L-alanine amidase [Hyphomicrobiales bacterium]